jgi:hypothetical protein
MMLFFSRGAGREQQCPGRLRHCRRAAGQGAAGAPVRPQVGSLSVPQVGSLSALRYAACPPSGRQPVRPQVGSLYALSGRQLVQCVHLR